MKCCTNLQDIILNILQRPSTGYNVQFCIVNGVQTACIHPMQYCFSITYTHLKISGNYYSYLQMQANTMTLSSGGFTLVPSALEVARTLRVNKAHMRFRIIFWGVLQSSASWICRWVRYTPYLGTSSTVATLKNHVKK